MNIDYLGRMIGPGPTKRYYVATRKPLGTDPGDSAVIDRNGGRVVAKGMTREEAKALASELESG